MSEQLPEAIPAATLIIFRDAGYGPPELLMVERAKAMVFAGGAMVFPGGRIDPGDHVLAELLGGDDETAARIGAVRETIEEAGLPVGLAELPSAEKFASMRAALHDGKSFAEALADADARLDLNLLTPWARWRPAHANMRIFDTRFYLAELPADAPRATVDQTENVRLVWSTAQQVLDDADAGKLNIIFPTRRNLERLAQFESYADTVAHAEATPIVTVTPWQEPRGGEEHLCIPDNAGYPVTSEAISRAERGTATHPRAPAA